MKPAAGPVPCLPCQPIAKQIGALRAELRRAVAAQSAAGGRTAATCARAARQSIAPASAWTSPDPRDADKMVGKSLTLSTYLGGREVTRERVPVTSLPKMELRTAIEAS